MYRTDPRQYKMCRPKMAQCESERDIVLRHGTHCEFLGWGLGEGVKAQQATRQKSLLAGYFGFVILIAKVGTMQAKAAHARFTHTIPATHSMSTFRIGGAFQLSRSWVPSEFRRIFFT